MKTGKSFWVWILLVLLTGLLAFTTGDDLFFRLFILWLGLFLFSYIWARYSLTGILLTRIVKEDKVEVGQYIYETVYVENRSKLPKIWLELIDNSSIPGSISSRVITNLKANRTSSYSAYVIAEMRGLYKLGPTKIRSGDVFGLFTNERIESAQSQILITPMIVDLNHLSEAIGKISGGDPARKKTEEETPHSTTIRPYQPGDPLKRIHWPSTARIGQYMVKEFEFDPQTEVALFINSSRTTQWREKNSKEIVSPWVLGKRTKKTIRKDSTEYIATIAASVGNYFLGHGKMIAAYTNDNIWTQLPPDKGSRQLEKLIENLAILKGDGELSLSGLVSTYCQSLPRGSQVWVISTVYENDILNVAIDLRARSFYPQVILIYPDEWNNEEYISKRNSLLSNGIPTYMVITNGSISSIVTSISSSN